MHKKRPAGISCRAVLINQFKGLAAIQEGACIQIIYNVTITPPSLAYMLLTPLVSITRTSFT